MMMKSIQLFVFTIVMLSYYVSCEGDDGGVTTADAAVEEPPQIAVAAPAIIATLSPSEFCNLPAYVGQCRASKERYYYDGAAKECHKFNYGGCEGNQNNFLTLAECEKTCKTTFTPY